MPIVQCHTISGQFIDEARWYVSTLQNLREGQNLQISLPVNDQRLIEYISNLGKIDCSIERNRENKEHTVTLTLTVVGFRHMLEPPNKGIESMAIAVPTNRTIENVLLYLVKSSFMDPRFTIILNNQ